MGISCPYCGVSSKSHVVNKRDSDISIRRRRMCLNCGKRFSTYEFRADEIRRIRNAGINPHNTSDYSCDQEQR